MKELELFKFAFIPNYEGAIQYLAKNLADHEEWDFTIRKSDHPFPILKNYLEYTFRKVKSEGKISYTPNNSAACFNTGLVTRNLEPIFAYFEANISSKNITNSSGEIINPASFYFRAFLRESDSLFLRIFPSNHPDTADYFQKPEDLIFNPNCTIIPQIDHIIDDNINRFPKAFLNIGPDEVRRRLTGAIDEVKRRVKTNYKLAVPQFFNGKIQLLLPLNLTPNSLNPDLALATYRCNDQTYSARTCLTLEMAYNNARLIVKPQSDWLKP